MKILNTITFDKDIFLEAEYVKVVPILDAEFGAVISVREPGERLMALDKSWMQVEYSSANEVARFRRPAILNKYFGREIVPYVDQYSRFNEIFRIRLCDGDFSEIMNYAKKSRRKYYPYFTSDGKYHIPSAWARSNVSIDISKRVYVKCSSPSYAVRKGEFVVSIFCDDNLGENEIAYPLRLIGDELVTPPIRVAILKLGKSIVRFKFCHCDGMSIWHKRIRNERHKRRIRRRISGIRQRAQRARRERNRSRRTEKIDRQ